MKIHDDHMFHGATLLQIAEHPRFTAINSLTVLGKKSRSAYRINDTIGVYLKYASKPSNNLGEYSFTFTSAHLKELREISEKVQKTFLALVCVKDREIACLSLNHFRVLVERRRQDRGRREAQYVVLVTAPERKALRVCVNKSGRRKLYLGEPLVVKRNAFPGNIFD